jgi:hypothetical protein
MEKLTRNKGLFIGLSCLSVGCLVGSFGYPLQKLEVYSQPERGSFNQTYEQKFIITESDLNYPWGFDEKRAKRIAAIYQDYKLQKIFLLILSGLCAGYALQMGTEVSLNSEIDLEVETIKAQGKKQLLLEKVKHSLAMASKAQRLLFLDEMKAMIAEFGGGQEEEILEADELNALYEEVMKETPEEKVESKGLSEEAIRQQFPSNMDEATWKAITKAESNGASKEEVLSDVLAANNDIGSAYYELLTAKYK